MEQIKRVRERQKGRMVPVAFPEQLQEESCPLLRGDECGDSMHQTHSV